MAGHARYTALLDACVLFPPAVADALMSLHVAGLFAARWTERVETEWIDAVSRSGAASREQLAQRRDAMRRAVPDWEVPELAYRSLMAGITLPDPDDIHVLAAAIAGHADCIVTMNLRDFPAAILTPLGLEVLHPDDFIINQLDLDSCSALAAFKSMRARRRNPPSTPEEFIEVLERNQLVATAARLREACELI